MADPMRCHATVLQGPRKGLPCQLLSSEHGYCVHHQRSGEHDQWIREGKHPCGMFFRGCNQETSEEDRAQGYIHCLTCRQQKRRRGFPCQAPGCSSTIPTEEQRYCKKHPMYSRCHPSADPLCPEQQRKERWRALQQKAYQQGIFFMLPFEQADSLLEQPCVYCDTPFADGIDRADPTKGYLLSNCLPCCASCLAKKGTQHPLDFLDGLSVSYDRARFESIRITPLKPYRGRSYSVAHIYSMMTDGSYHFFIEWCLERRTPEFVSAMNEIRHGSHSPEESQHAIREELEQEPNRRRIPPTEKKTLHASTMYAYLVTGHVNIIKEWYQSRYRPSVLYEERLRDLMDCLPTMDPAEGREACQQMMLDEHQRRLSQERRDRERIPRLQEVDVLEIPVASTPLDIPTMSEISTTYRSRPILLPEVDPFVLPCNPEA